MSKFVQVEDFTGEFKIPTDSFTEELLQSYINKYEKQYFIKLVGINMYKLFDADFNTTTKVPTEARFLAIWNAIEITINDCNLISEGINQMLVQFIFWEFIRNTPVKNTIGGPQKNSQQNAKEALVEESNIFNAYNQAIDNFQAIQYYILENPEDYDYESYLGEFLEKTGWI